MGAVAPTVWTGPDRVRADGGSGRSLGRCDHAGLCQVNQPDLLEGELGPLASERELAAPRFAFTAFGDWSSFGRHPRN